MSSPFEHDYIGLSEPSSMERSSESSNLSTETEKNNVLNLKATELRLGLPGFGKDSEENATKNGATKNLMSRAKRGFCDVNIDVSGKWVFNGGSEGELGKSSSVLFSPRSGISAGPENNPTHPSVPLSAVIKPVEENKKAPVVNENGSSPPAAKAQVVGWPPIRSFRKNTMATNLSKNVDAAEGSSCLYVKVSMDGAPYLRKIDLKIYHNYAQLSKALEKMFSCFALGRCTSDGLGSREGLSESNIKDILHGSEYVLTYEDKDGDWMLVGDVPWEMFMNSCKRLRIMKGSEAIGLAPRCKSKN